MVEVLFDQEGSRRVEGFWGVAGGLVFGISGLDGENKWEMGVNGDWGEVEMAQSEGVIGAAAGTPDPPVARYVHGPIQVDDTDDQFGGCGVWSEGEGKAIEPGGNRAA